MRYAATSCAAHSQQKHALSDQERERSEYYEQALAVAEEELAQQRQAAAAA